MPTWTELQTRVSDIRNPKVRTTGEEELVADVRARMSPGHFIEEKLRMALAVERPHRRKPK